MEGKSLKMKKGIRGNFKWKAGRGRRKGAPPATTSPAPAAPPRGLPSTAPGAAAETRGRGRWRDVIVPRRLLAFRSRVRALRNRGPRRWLASLAVAALLGWLRVPWPLALRPASPKGGGSAIIAHRRCTYLGGLCKARGREGPGLRLSRLSGQACARGRGARGSPGAPPGFPLRTPPPLWRDPPFDCRIESGAGRTWVPSPALAPAWLLCPRLPRSSGWED